MTTSAAVEKKWYVYALCDPETEQPFYIGKGAGNRMEHHERYADANEIKQSRIKEIQDAGKNVLKKKIAEFSDERDALIYEFATICVYASSLTNIKWSPYVRKEPIAVKDFTLCVGDLAKIFGVHNSTIMKLASSGKIPGVKIVGQWRFRRVDIEDFVKKQMHIPPEEKR